MKLNLGCGTHKKDGYVNVDMFAESMPDVVCNLETTPWPWETSSISEVYFHHSLEHMGREPEVFFGIMKELYRVCADGCTIQINVPHPRHDDFINDPTHVRPITAAMMELFNKSSNLEWKKNDTPNTPLGLYLGVDFKMTYITYIIDEPYITYLREKKIDDDELARIMKEKNNVIKELRITMVAVKQ